MSKVLQMREAHFPSRAPIDAYGQGGFRFADLSHRGGVLCLPSGIYGANFKEGEIMLENIFPILKEKQNIEFLLIGTGEKIQPLKDEVRSILQEERVAFELMNTGAAVRTFNVLLAEDRAIAALLLPVE